MKKILILTISLCFGAFMAMPSANASMVIETSSVCVYGPGSRHSDGSSSTTKHADDKRKEGDDHSGNGSGNSGNNNGNNNGNSDSHDTNIILIFFF